MSQSVEEQLSALLDDELSVEEEELLFRRLGGNSEYSAVLSRYSLIRELIASPDTEPVAMQLSERVRIALQDEAIVVKSDLQSNSGLGTRNGLFRFAAAAAVATVAVMAFVNLDYDFDTRQTIASVSPGLSYSVPETRADRRVIEPFRLTGYLVSHGSFANSLSRRVMDSQIVSRMPQTVAWQLSTISGDE